LYPELPIQHLRACAKRVSLRTIIAAPCRWGRAVRGRKRMSIFNPITWSHRVKIIVAFASMYMIWGSTYLAIRVGLENAMPPSLLAGVRLVTAGLIMFTFARWRGYSLRMPRHELVIIVIIGIFLLCGGMYFTVLAEQYVPSSLSALLVAAVPLWVASAEGLLPGMDRLTGRGILGLLIGFTGLGILMYPRLTGMQGDERQFLGIGLQLIATWLWTTGSIISKRNPVKTNGIVATAWEMFAAGVILTLVGVVRGELGALHSVTAAGVGALAYLSVMGSCVAFTAFMWLLRNVPASKVMTYTYVNPVVAVFLGWAAGYIGLLPEPEPVNAWVITGMVVIVLGVALTTSSPMKSSRTNAPVEPDAEPALELA
jgi:drug/metabolite transporter (DMT)-like permease